MENSEKILQTKIMEVSFPTKINTGDPYYYSLSKSEIERLTYNKNFRCKSDWLCEVGIEEVQDLKLDCNQNRWYLRGANTKELFNLLKDSKYYSNLKVDEKSIGVDTAEYLLKINSNELTFKTGSDGYFGTIVEYKEGNKLVALEMYFYAGLYDEFNELQSNMEYLFGQKF